MSLVLSLTHPCATNPALTGGKGSRLASLTHEGFAVPEALLVTADAYDQFVAQASDLFAEAVTDWSGVAARLSELPLPAETIAGIRQRLADFPDDAYVVRSSSTLEDLADSAFAGQHETFLNVRGAASIAEHVRLCFLSLWNERAISYRQQRGFDHRKARMAVVIQRLIRAEVAGVAFSMDPVSGDATRIAIEANYGLGESVVSGETSTDHWLLDRCTFQVKEAAIATKTGKTVATATGVAMQPLQADEGSMPCLNAAQLAQVATLAVQIEERAGFPQDIEWGIAGGKLWLLQARAITTLTPRWTRQESAERFPNPITPLTWEFVEEAFHESLGWSFRLMGLPPCKGKWFARFDGYIYGNQSLVELYCGRLPFHLGSLEDLDPLIPKLRAQYHWVQKLPADWSRDLDGYLLKIGAATATDPRGIDSAALWRHAQDLVAHGAHYFRPNIAISITHGLLCRLLHRLVTLVAPEEETLTLFQGLLAWGNTRTSQINRELRELVSVIERDAALSLAVENSGAADFLKGNLAGRFPAFASRFAKFISDHGHRETDFDMYQSPWGDAPDVVLDHLRALLKSPGLNGDDVERSAKLAAHEAERRFLALAPERGRFFFAEILRLARTYTQLDDEEHYQTTRLNLPLRRALGELGARLRSRDLLVEPFDIFFASRAQIDELLDSTVSFRDKEVIAMQILAQKAAWQTACGREPAWQPGEDMPPAELATGAGHRGLPGSPGIAEGVIHHVRGPADFADFPAGAVLVSRTTNPAWTPLFHLAAAVVTESGGPLSHGAVTARELGIPAVMAVPGCLSLLAQGRRVRVDGLRGLVIPLDERDIETMEPAHGNFLVTAASQ